MIVSVYQLTVLSIGCTINRDLLPFRFGGVCARFVERTCRDFFCISCTEGAVKSKQYTKYSFLFTYMYQQLETHLVRDASFHFPSVTSFSKKQGRYFTIKVL
jgi:hypothetical protein